MPFAVPALTATVNVVVVGAERTSKVLLLNSFSLVPLVPAMLTFCFAAKAVAGAAVTCTVAVVPETMIEEMTFTVDPVFSSVSPAAFMQYVKVFVVGVVLISTE